MNEEQVVWQCMKCKTQEPAVVCINDITGEDDIRLPEGWGTVEGDEDDEADGFVMLLCAKCSPS